jgi:hypothetical protein
MTTITREVIEAIQARDGLYRREHHGCATLRHADLDALCDLALEALEGRERERALTVEELRAMEQAMRAPSQKLCTVEEPRVAFIAGSKASMTAALARVLAEKGQL